MRRNVLTWPVSPGILVMVQELARAGSRLRAERRGETVSRVTHLLGVVCVTVAVLPVAVRAAETDKAVEDFDSLYGRDVKRVKGTRDTKDDVELAARLLAAAKKAADQPPLLAVLCEKAYDLATVHADGYETALAAMGFLKSEVPAKAGECAEREVSVLQKQFTKAPKDAKAEPGEALLDAMLALLDSRLGAGDAAEASKMCGEARRIAIAIKSERRKDIEERQNDVKQAIQDTREIENLKALLDKESENTAAREKLVRLCLNAGRPAEAAKYVEGVEDEALRKYVPAAAKPVEEAPELACVELGEWYRGLAEAAPSYARLGMYERARAYLERFLKIHTAKDQLRTRAVLALEKVEAALEKLGRSRWIDLLAMVDPTRDMVMGRWLLLPDGLAVIWRPGDPRGPWARILVPAAPQGSYELKGRFVRTSENREVFVVLPVGKRGVALLLSAKGGDSSGLNSIKGNYGAVVRPGALENGREYALHAQVVLAGEQAEVTVKLDGEPYMAWKGPLSDLSVGKGLEVTEPGCFGLGVQSACVLWRSLRLKMLSGKVRSVRPKPKGKAIARNKWVNVLAFVANKQGSSVSFYGNRRIILPVAPQGSYELQAVFVRRGGEGAVGFILPAGSTGVVLALSNDGGKRHELGMIDSQSASSGRPAVIPGKIINKKEYALYVKVLLKGDRAEITAALDKKPLIFWRGPASALSIPPGWELHAPGVLGLGSGPDSHTGFRTVRLRMLSGEARLAQ